MNVDLRLLRSLSTVAAAGSVAAAAKLLNKVPSGVSYDLARLEERLGFAVIDRRTKSARITPSGHVMVEAYDRAMRELQRAVDYATNLGDHTVPLRIAVVSGFGRYRLLPRLMTLLGPARTLDVRVVTAEDAMALVESGEVDYGVTYRPLVGGGLECIPIAQEHLVLVAHATAAPVAAEAVGALRFVTYDEFEYVYARWFEAHAIALPERWTTADHFTELEEVMEAVARGRGYSIVPADVAYAPQYSERVRIDDARPDACVNEIFLFASPGRMRPGDVDLIKAASRDDERAQASRNSPGIGTTS